MLISKGISKSKIKIIYNPSPMIQKAQPNLRNKLRISKEKKIILYAGRLSKDKGIHKTIEAISDLDDVVFLIIGKKRDYYSNLKKLIKNLKIEDKVIFLGFIDNSKIGKYFSIADLVTHPCSFYEPLSRMLIEAACYGLPIIASNSGGNSEIVVNNTNGYIVSNKEGLKNKIKKLLNNSKLANIMGNNSTVLVAPKFDPEVIGKSLIKEYINIKKI